jgi:uncharacterized membrane protein YphA (DoxX/SURF4 family)
MRMNSTNDITTLAGRILMSVMFLISGFFKVGGYAQIVGYAAAVHLPMPGVAIAVAWLDSKRDLRLGCCFCI